MDLFSLEDDDCNGMFITQTSPQDTQMNDVLSNSVPDRGFITPVSLYLKRTQPHYSDISDYDFVDIPCSQIPKNVAAEGVRYV